MSFYEGKVIHAVAGEEPTREGERPSSFVVGMDVSGVFDGLAKSVTVTRIEHRVDNRGDHGVGWFDVFAGAELIASLNERHTAEVAYRDPAKEIPA